MKNTRKHDWLCSMRNTICCQFLDVWNIFTRTDQNIEGKYQWSTIYWELMDSRCASQPVSNLQIYNAPLELCAHTSKLRFWHPELSFAFSRLGHVASGQKHDLLFLSQIGTWLQCILCFHCLWCRQCMYTINCIFFSVCCVLAMCALCALCSLFAVFWLSAVSGSVCIVFICGQCVQSVYFYLHVHSSDLLRLPYLKGKNHRPVWVMPLFFSPK